jgi:hypothetical protein
MHFRELLQRARETAPDKHDALIEVCDTAMICQAWFKAHDLVPTAADVVALAGLVLARERENLSG